MSVATQPCPFCGGPTEVHTIYVSYDGRQSTHDINAVHCRRPECAMICFPDNTRHVDNVTKRYNERASSSETLLKQENEALAGMLNWAINALEELRPFCHELEFAEIVGNPKSIDHAKVMLGNRTFRWHKEQGNEAFKGIPEMVLVFSTISYKDYGNGNYGPDKVHTIVLSHTKRVWVFEQKFPKADRGEWAEAEPVLKADIEQMEKNANSILTDQSAALLMAMVSRADAGDFYLTFTADRDDPKGGKWAAGYELYCPSFDGEGLRAVLDTKAKFEVGPGNNPETLIRRIAAKVQDVPLPDEQEIEELKRI